MEIPAHATILLADDHPMFRAALRQAVRETLPDCSCIEASDDATLRSAAEAHPDTDLVLLDLMMPGSRGFGTLVWLRSQFPTMAVIVVSASERVAVMRRALAFGAAGYVPKSASLADLVAAIRAVIDCGQSFPPEMLVEDPLDGERSPLAARLASLTSQQFRVLELLAQGKLNKQIAAELGIIEQTAKAHVSAALAKLGARNRTQAVLLFKELEIHEADPLSFDR
jgi:DNA-binding NarL/FixJ family response regulator